MSQKQLSNNIAKLSPVKESKNNAIDISYGS